MDYIKIEFELATPVSVAAFPIHLDSLIAYAVVEREKSLGATGDIREIIQNLPLDKAIGDNDWCWKASRLDFEPGVRNMRQWTRRTDPADYAARYMAGEIYSGKKPPASIPEAKDKAHSKTQKQHALKIDTLRGDFKNHQQFFEVEQSRKAVAYCVGHLDEVIALLSLDSGFITSIGKRGTRGFGKIRKTTIAVDEAAKDNWKDRVLPWQENESYVPLLATVRPPYFDRTLVQEAWLPV